MTTIREWAQNYCSERGMFEEQAKDVVELLIADPLSEPMNGRWDESVEDYPPQLLAALSLSLRENAVKWIDDNLPQAFFRPLFVD